MIRTLLRRLAARLEFRRAERIAERFSGPLCEQARAIGAPLGEAVARERAASGGARVPAFLMKQANDSALPGRTALEATGPAVAVRSTLPPPVRPSPRLDGSAR